MNQEEMNNLEGAPEGEARIEPEAPVEDVGSAAPETGLKRRELLKTLAGVPVVGWLAWRALRKVGVEGERRQQVVEELGDLQNAPAVLPELSDASGDLIRLGIIGAGGEGRHLLRCAGFVPKETTDRWRQAVERDSRNNALSDFLNQPDLNVELTAVCDVFDVHAELALDAATNPQRPGSREPMGARRHRHYQDLLRDPNVDAVIIATPDHWHARMIVDAAAEGKPVYVEKAMTRTEQETHDVYKAVTEAGIAFQLGHQNRQIESHEKARQIIEKGLLGPINLVETTTNRNSPNGAWVYNIHEESNAQTIDWDQFQEPAPNKVPFSAERFHRWRCWFDYGTGLSGDLFSHEYDSVNQILGMGIPATVSASGGIYFYKQDEFFRHHDPERFPMTEDRDVPDVFHIACEYPDRNMTLLYSSTLSNGNWRGMKFMGHDATMEVGGDLTIHADGESTRYRQKIRRRMIDTSLPLFTWQQGAEGFDAVTSASDQYFISRGLLYTYRGGVRVPTNTPHIAEWLDAIRNGGTTSCNIERGFEEGITCHMATRSYLEGRRVSWDPVGRRIV
jgi:predicted dehydrogenase